MDYINTVDQYPEISRKGNGPFSAKSLFRKALCETQAGHCSFFFSLHLSLPFHLTLGKTMTIFLGFQQVHIKD